MNWLVFFKTADLFSQISIFYHIHKAEVQQRKLLQRACTRIQIFFKNFLKRKYARTIDCKELIMVSSLIRGSTKLLSKKTKKKSRHIFCKFLSFTKGNFNFQIYLNRFYDKILLIQKRYREYRVKKQNKFNILKDLCDKTIIRMIKHELEAEFGKKSKKKKKTPKDSEKLKKLQNINKENKEKTLLKYFDSKIAEHKIKIKEYILYSHSLSKEQRFLTEFLKKTASSKRNSLFFKERPEEESLKDLNYEVINNKIDGLKELKKPLFEFMPEKEEMDKIIDEIIEKK